MILEAIAKTFKGPTAEERIEARRQRDREIAVVFDQQQGAGRFSVPVSDLYANLPASCRYGPNMWNVRIWGAVIGACVGAPLMYGFFIPLLGVIMAPVPGVLMGAFIGSMVGWAVAPRYAPKPLWIVRRIEVPADPATNGRTARGRVRVHEQPNPDGVQMGSADASHFLAMEDGTRRYLIPWQHTHLQGEPDIAPSMNGHQAVAGLGNGSAGVATAPPPDVRVHRATNLYHMLEATDERADLRPSGMSGWDKVKVGSMVAIAFGVLGVLILLFLITQNPAGAT